MWMLILFDENVDSIWRPILNLFGEDVGLFGIDVELNFSRRHILRYECWAYLIWMLKLFGVNVGPIFWGDVGRMCGC